MAFGAGMDEIDVKLVKRNIEAFEKTASIPIVAPCSSCSAHLKLYPNLFGEGEWKERAKRFFSAGKGWLRIFSGKILRAKGKPNAPSRVLRSMIRATCGANREYSKRPENYLKIYPG